VSHPWVVSARAGRVDAEERAWLAERLAGHPGILLVTCHRVELHGSGDIGAPLIDVLPTGTRVLRDRAAVEHIVAVALGLDSVVLAEDQVLFQLRSALDAARRNGGLDSRLERLLDAALRAGRRGRSWLPARRPSLADLALAAVPDLADGATVLVVGAGRMGELAARAATARHASVTVTSRTPEHAAALAQRMGLATAAFDPGTALAHYRAIVVALAGHWPLSPLSVVALVDGDTQVVDLSSPPAVPQRLRLALAERYHSIDQLGEIPGGGPTDALVRRLKGLAATTVDEYLDWASRDGRRDAAREVVERAERIRGGELEELWRRVPALPQDQRAQIELMTERLAARLMREPLERLGRDTDGDGERAARELFGL